MSNITAGVRISLRGEDFLVTGNSNNIVDTIGITELVKGIKFSFDLGLEDYDIITPEKTDLVADTSNNYRRTKLFIETILRNSSHYTDSIEIANKGVIRSANYQYVPTIKALNQPKPRILIADAVGLGKTVQVGIFMAELIRRGKGERILVVTPKSILAQFQQEIWSRFAIPLVRLDSQGIARIKSDIPSNKNPFDFYDKVIVSIDTLKNNGRFRHYLEKTHWDIVAIDECHLVANASSQRGGLARYLAPRCEAMVLTSATPHNGRKENFANLIKLLDPTAIPFDGDFTHEDIQPLYVRRFKKDIEDEAGDAFQDRISETLFCQLAPEEEVVLDIIQNFKKRAYEESDGNMSNGMLLFSIGLFKAYMSSPKACLEGIKRRMKKRHDEPVVESMLLELKSKIENILISNQDTRYNRLLTYLKEKKWSGKKKDDRIIIFSERRDTLDELEKKMKADFSLSDSAIIQFNGSLTDIQQQKILEDFSKADSSIRLFLASDAGSQGVNLHYHCHIMFNYDIPWSIITLDQRNGRIDRFGQDHRPEIFYLISKTDNKNILGDIRILEKLKQKEEEVHKSLGDAQEIWKLFDSSKEEKRIEEAIAKSDAQLLENEPEELDDNDWLVMLGVSEEEKEIEKEKVKFDAGFTSFYQNDFRYYFNLKAEIIDHETELANKFMIDEEAEVMEIERCDELSRYGVLYDIPKEAFPPKKETFKLTTNSDLVEAAIKEARKKKGDWSKFQLLYDLHPIARWMQFKLLAKVDKGKALVCRMRHPLPEKSAWFVFQGITSNGQGRPILSKTFVVGRSFTGQSVGNLNSFSEFIVANQIRESLPTLEIPEEQLEQLKKLLPDAVTSAKKLYKFTLQGDLEDEIEDKHNVYSERLNKWTQDSEKQLELKFGNQNIGAHKKRRKQEVKRVFDNMNEFYEDFFQLENDPFIRLLAVFYHD